VAERLDERVPAEPEIARRPCGDDDAESRDGRILEDDDVHDFRFRRRGAGRGGRGQTLPPLAIAGEAA
jgi:hypothetical protein